MTKPVIDSFFFGRALAEVLNEKIEDAITNALSELGKFDAEQRENLRIFTEEVIERAAREIDKRNSSSSPFGSDSSPAQDQKMIDDLRAEIATLRAELTKYRQGRVE